MILILKRVIHVYEGDFDKGEKKKTKNKEYITRRFKNEMKKVIESSTTKIKANQKYTV